MIEHRKELRQKVEARQQELEQALKASETEGHPPERIAGIKNQMSVATDAMGGGWDKMTDVSAERLSTWLTSTMDLVAAQPKPIGVTKIKPPEAVDPKLPDVKGQN